MFTSDTSSSTDKNVETEKKINVKLSPEDRRVNEGYYFKAVRRLRETIQKNARNSGPTNCGYCTTTIRQLARHCLFITSGPKQHHVIMSRSAYSQKVAPCDFFLLPTLERPMKGHCVALHHWECSRPYHKEHIGSASAQVYLSISKEGLLRKSHLSFEHTSYVHTSEMIFKNEIVNLP